MPTYSLKEAQAQFSNLLRDAAAGEEVWVEREDGARARIVPVSDDDAGGQLQVSSPPAGPASPLRRSGAR